MSPTILGVWGEGKCCVKSPVASAVQINPNREKLRSEEPYRPHVSGAARQMARQPALALAWIVISEQMCSARVPVKP